MSTDCATGRVIPDLKRPNGSSRQMVSWESLSGPLLRGIISTGISNDTRGSIVGTGTV